LIYSQRGLETLV